MIDDCILVKSSELSKPQTGLFKNYVDYWWIMTDTDEVLFYKDRIPQCNAKKEVVEYVRDRSYPNLKVKQIPFISISIEPGDWNYTV